MTEPKDKITRQETKTEAMDPDYLSVQKIPSQPSPSILDFAQRLGELVGKWLALNREPRDS